MGDNHCQCKCIEHFTKQDVRLYRTGYWNGTEEDGSNFLRPIVKQAKVQENRTVYPLGGALCLPNFSFSGI
jgi:hypothetical protein